MSSEANIPREGDGKAPGFKLTPLFLLKNFEEIIGCVGMCVIIAVISLNVFLRYFFSKSIPWAEEVAVIGFSCVIFIGSAAAFKRHMHVGIDFLVGLLPPRARAAVSMATSIFVLAFNAYITYLGWIYTCESWDKPTSILFIPYSFVVVPICIGFASMTVYAAMDLIARLRRDYAGGVTQRFKEGDV